jgi:hypothetical protein
MVAQIEQIFILVNRCYLNDSQIIIEIINTD